jgi:hypothetical protein
MKGIDGYKGQLQKFGGSKSQKAQSGFKKSKSQERIEKEVKVKRLQDEK